MKTLVAAAVGSFLFLALGTAVQAQGPYVRPPNTALSYLNLYRFGAPAALNYQNLVRPDLDTQAAIRQLQIQGQLNQQAITDVAANPGPLVTGHAAGFMTHRSYFQTMGGGTGVGTTGATAGTWAGGRTASFGNTVRPPIAAPGAGIPPGPGIR